METSLKNKNIILTKIRQYDADDEPNFKLRNWITKIMNVPFGKYINLNININEAKENLIKMKEQLESNIYGHKETKDQILKIIAHTISNPSEGGSIFALEGPPGVGKTAFINDGLSKILNRPYAFISLGGATDGSLLNGFGYTYEGSNHGRIVDVLINSGCMNPIIFFDELDKISETPHGLEITNTLIHLTDITQNNHFNDRYFGGIDFDLSKAILIFSFNDRSKISRILRDRMKIITINGYKLDDKIELAEKFIIPKLLKVFNMENLIFQRETLIYLIDNYTNEGGVRRLKELLNDILMEINLNKLFNSDVLEINMDNVDSYLKFKDKLEFTKIHNEPTVGLINGLWANDYGIGGILPIECALIPSNNKLELKLTGMQGDVMKESMNVAKSVALKLLPENIKDELLNGKFNYDIHIHCPDGATPKDGPSAGCAITICILSLLMNKKINNKMAITGEINLQGNVTIIGGLEEKLFGAKKAGVSLVFCSKQNSKDLLDIVNKYPNLINDNFNVKIIEHINEVLFEIFI